MLLIIKHFLSKICAALVLHLSLTCLLHGQCMIQVDVLALFFFNNADIINQTL